MKRAYAVLFAVVLFAAIPLPAQECKPTDTINECLRKVGAREAEVVEEVTEETAASAATGITSVASPAESSLKDFLSLLDASLESATSAEQGQAYTFDWNPPIAFAKKWGAKLQASFAETKLNDKVTASLSANATKVEELKDSLEFGDDTTLSGFLQPQNDRFGRSIEPHSDWFRPMRDAILEERRQEGFDLGDLIDEFNIVSADQRFENLKDDAGQKAKPERVEKAIAGIVELAQRVEKARAGREKFFMAFAKLLNNQPQLYGAVIFHARRNLIGPNEWSGKFTYEIAGNNLNAFKKAQKKTANPCETITAANATSCADELRKFADSVRPGLERLALSLEYHRVNRRWIADTAAGLDLGFPRSRSFVGSFAFGTNTAPMLPMRAATTGVGDARLDFTAKYELPEDDNSEEKGFVGTLTYTQKISETFSLPLSFVYSDHESDLINVQKRFSARFGLMYKLPDFK